MTEILVDEEKEKCNSAGNDGVREPAHGTREVDFSLLLFFCEVRACCHDDHYSERPDSLSYPVVPVEILEEILERCIEFADDGDDRDEDDRNGRSEQQSPCELLVVHRIILLLH